MEQSQNFCNQLYREYLPHLRRIGHNVLDTVFFYRPMVVYGQHYSLHCPITCFPGTHFELDLTGSQDQLYCFNPHYVVVMSVDRKARKARIGKINHDSIRNLLVKFTEILLVPVCALELLERQQQCDNAV